MASQPVKPSLRVQGQRLWWTHHRGVFCRLHLYSKVAFNVGLGKERPTRSLHSFNVPPYAIHLAGCSWVSRHSALGNRMLSCTVGWFLFWLRNSSFPKIFKVDGDCARESVRGTSLVLSGFSAWEMWALKGSLRHNSEWDQVASAQLCKMLGSFLCDRQTFGVFCWLSRTLFRGSPEINHLMSHCLPDSQPFVLKSRPWLDSRFSSLDFDRLHVSRPLLDSRFVVLQTVIRCSTLDFPLVTQNLSRHL